MFSDTSGSRIRAEDLKLTTIDDDKINDFLGGPFVPSFKDGETREYEFDKEVKLVDKKDYNGDPIQALRYTVRDLRSRVQTSKFWDLTRKHGNVYRELKYGNDGKGWTAMEITRQGTGMNTRYVPKGIG
jgi:hypothetical protein